MRILVPGPLYDDSFSDNISATLRAMGHEVRTFRPRPVSHFSSLSYLAKSALERLRGERPSWDDLRLLEESKRFRPDMLLSPTWDVHPEVLDQVGKICEGRRVLWWGDAPSNSGRWGLVNPFWDRVYVKDQVAVAKLALVGIRAALLEEAMNPQWHRPSGVSTGRDLVVAGNAYPYRQAIVSALLAQNVMVALYGPKPPVWSRPEMKRSWRGEYITRERKSAVFEGGLACLNTFNFSEGDSLNCRAFEICGSGGLQLIEYRPALERSFEPGREVLAFRTAQELAELLARAARDVSAIRVIREAGCRRAHAEHTYRRRLETILENL